MGVRPLVSIVTPSYNQARYLEQTIQSVIYQPACGEIFDLEYIIVDGGSTDGSQDIIRKYQSSLAWWVSERDHGQAEAINKGLRRARGEIVAWLNSDDLYLPGALAQAVRILEQDSSLGMVFGDAIAIDESAQPIHRWSFGNWGLREFLRFRVICQPAVFLRRSVVERVGYLDESYHCMLDHHLWIRIAVHSRVCHVASLWAAARQHNQAKNVAWARRFSEETQRVYEWMLAQPNLASMIAADRRKVLGGMYRLQARYSLDGEEPSPALRYYARALYYDPPYALKHWHRMLYATLLWVGGKKVKIWMETVNRKRRNKFARAFLASVTLRSRSNETWYNALGDREDVFRR
ncbi:MAG: glycosyltransferase family 2 protein [Anaerolineales bacterium]|nr:glycosyltransferase [Anaerolineales bacterium]MDW8446389.1 glycosyltransferase family 2 protein [Anaerolineales bacterium]